jgi:ankyrin repeat protein
MLLDHNADPLLSNDQGYGAHSMAHFNNFREIADYIAAAGLQRAIRNGDLTSARVMIQDGAPVNTQTEVGATVLMVAAHAGDLDLVTWLLNHPHIQPDFQESDGWTAVMFAAFFDHPEVVRALLDHGIDLGVRTVHQQTVLDLAQTHGRQQVVQVLRERLALLEDHQRRMQAEAQAAPQDTQDALAAQQSQARQQAEPASHTPDTSAQTSPATGIKVEEKPGNWFKGLLGG